MKTLTKSFEYAEVESDHELDEKDRVLVEKARAAIPNSYAPYSRYRVASSLRLKDGTIVIGTNQENAAYPSGLCAERVAIFSASANYPGMLVESIAIVVSSLDFTINEPAAPCGSCRQVIIEYEQKQDQPIRLILAGEEGKILLVPSCKDLLPLYFQENQLKKE
jgi:cytidine deaminase